MWSKVVALGLPKSQTLGLDVMEPKELLGFKFLKFLP